MKLIDGRFQLLHPVGAGGMGVVYRAHDEQTNQPVAVKLLEGRSPLEIDRAHREAEVLARLDHPAIVGHVSDGVTEEGQLYLAMQWVEGVSLAQQLDSEGVTLREAVAIVRRIADALGAAHDAGILHRDIKPTNILLANGDPAAAMLIDFGIARVADAVKSLTRTGIALGTPGYMSPEQARGSRELTPACDVFGLGCVLYECATARPAFSGANPAAVLVKILMAEPPAVAMSCPEMPAPLAALVTRMLSKNPARRVPDGLALARELDAIGDVPAGPRRSPRQAAATATVVEQAPAEMECVVLAGQGVPDDVCPPPSSGEYEDVLAIADQHDAAVEVLANGAIATRLTGVPPEVVHRAAACALALRDLLPRWSIAVSAPRPDVAAAAETGTVLLTRAAVADIFRAPADELAIRVERDAVRFLTGEGGIAVDAKPADPVLKRRR